ncbi:MAG: hypothetical protein IJC16_09725 [Rikenellaceae bacterium]|nr:hypothetical protein [Rikenellaceae bacterium]
MKLLLAAILFLLLAVSAQAQIGYTVAADSLYLGDTLHFDDRLSAKEAQFYHNLKEGSQKRKFSRFIYNMVFTGKGDNEEQLSDRIIDENSYFEQFNGKRIGDVRIGSKNVFSAPMNRLERFGNKVHRVTREKFVRRDLLFKPGDTFDAQLMLNNQHYLRQSRHLASADFIVTQTDDPDVVDVIVITRDQWTLSIDGNLNFNGRTRLEVYDQNIFGTGNRLGFSTSFDWKGGGYGGNRVEYDIPNLLGSFYHMHLIGGKSFERTDLGVTLNKDLILPTDYMVGGTFLNGKGNIYSLPEDTVFRVGSKQGAVWAGKSFYSKRINASWFVTGQYEIRDFYERPDVDWDLNPAFHNNQEVLLGAGLYREKFYTTNRIYGYGFNEYIAAGYKAEVVGGYQWGEFGGRGYLGLNFDMGGFASWGYLRGNASIGSYLNRANNALRQTTIDVRLHYFSNLLMVRRSQVRQFITLSVTRGFNRLRGSHELITFTDEDGLRSLSAYSSGEHRAVLNTETVVFTPVHIYGFKLACYGFADFGLIGNRNDFFKNAFMSTLGVGIRIKNERLIFNTIQIQLGVALGKGGLLDNRYFKLSSESRVHQDRYLPGRPSIIGYQ